MTNTGPFHTGRPRQLNQGRSGDSGLWTHRLHHHCERLCLQG